MSNIRFTNFSAVNSPDERLVRDPDSLSAFDSIDDATEQPFDQESPFSFVEAADDCPEYVTQLVKMIRSHEFDAASELVMALDIANHSLVIMHLCKKVQMSSALKGYILEFCDHLDMFGLCSSFSNHLRHETMIIV